MNETIKARLGEAIEDSTNVEIACRNGESHRLDLSTDAAEMEADAIIFAKGDTGGGVVVPYDEIVRLSYGDSAPNPHK